MKRYQILIFGFALEAFACGAPQEDEPGEPDIRLDPERIEFGTVLTSDGEHVALVTVHNDGDGDLHIQDVEVEDPAAPFNISVLGEMTVHPQSTTQLQVVFAPATSGAWEASALISTDDSDTPETHLVATGDILILDPATWDFGSVTVGCTVEATLTIANTGNADLVVDEVMWEAPNNELALSSLVATPLTMAPGDSAALDISYQPLDEISDSATLSLVSNGSPSPLTQTSVTGTGYYEDNTVDAFFQGGEQPVDILIAVDTSDTMEERLIEVAAQLADFAAAAIALGTDFRLGVIEADDGCVVGPHVWLDATFSASDAATAITAMLDPDHGGGTNADRAFMLLEAAQSETGSGDCNEGLLRENSRLQLVGISDEPEQSVNSWSYYLTLFQSYRDDYTDVVISGVGGDYPSGCDDAVPYTGVYEASVATGGLLLSICDPAWGAALAPLAETTDDTNDRYVLTSEPVPETIVVRIDDVASTLGWTYDSGLNAVVFDADFVPATGSTVEVSYALVGDCGE